MKVGFIASSIVLLSLWPAASRAEEPTPSSCKISPILACPGGDLRISVLVKKGHAPLASALVSVDVSTCSTLRMAAPLKSDSQTVVDGVRLVKTADSEGRVMFAMRAGGASACSRIIIVANGVSIGERTSVASPDQNGDLKVDQADLDVLRRKIGSKDAIADLDGDGRVTPSDLLIARLHVGHHADVVTPIKVTTWGEIKAGYR